MQNCLGNRFCCPLKCKAKQIKEDNFSGHNYSSETNTRCSFEAVLCYLHVLQRSRSQYRNCQEFKLGLEIGKADFLLNISNSNSSTSILATTRKIMFQ